MKRKAVAPAADENSHRCSICQEVLVSEPWGKLHPCKHAVHSSCAANWFYTRAKHMQEAQGGSIREASAQKHCPLCRQEWTLTGAPTVVTTLGASMEVSNLAISLAFSDLLLQHEPEGELLALPTSDPDPDSDAEEEGHDEPDDADEEEVDETSSPCRLCSRALAAENWTVLQPCRCRFHVTCLHRHVMSLASPQGRLTTRLPCPACKTEVDPPDLWDDFVHVYDVRPVVADEFLALTPALGASRRVHVNCFWALLVRWMTEKRDQEVEELLAVEPLPEEEAAGCHVYERQDDVDEVVEVCHACRLPLACNLWLCLACCRHKFHLRCLCQAAMEVDDKQRYIRACPVCTLAMVLNRDQVPWFFLWEPLSTLHYASKLQLHEVAFWWYLDLEAHRQELQGHQIFREQLLPPPQPATATAAAAAPSNSHSHQGPGGAVPSASAAESSSANASTFADGAAELV